MPVVSVSEAAAALGFRSRSALYRLKAEGQLSAYLRAPSGASGAERLELEPKGLPPLREHVARLIRPQINNIGRNARPRTDSRWGVVAGVLTEALADCGGLQLTGTEAQAVAAALPDALAEAFGAEGLEQLRCAVAAAGCWRAGPPAPDVAALAEWWGADGWGRWEPEAEPLEDGPFWEHVGAIVGGMMAGPFAGLTGPNASELFGQLGDAIGAVEAGVRWDQAQWDAATAGLLIADLEADAEDEGPAAELAQLLEADRLPPEVAEQARDALAISAARLALLVLRFDPTDCSEAVAELLQLLEAGRLPDDLADQVRAALAQAEQQAPAALPVVLTD